MYTHQNPNPFQSIASPCFAFGFLIPNVCNAHRRVSNRNRATDDTHRKSAQTNDHHLHTPIHPFPSPPSRVGPFGRQRSIANNEQLTPALSRARRNPGRGNVGPTSRKTPSRQTSAPPAPQKTHGIDGLFFPPPFSSLWIACPSLPSCLSCLPQPARGRRDRSGAVRTHDERCSASLALRIPAQSAAAPPPLREEDRSSVGPKPLQRAALLLCGAYGLFDRLIDRSEGRRSPPHRTGPARLRSDSLRHRRRGGRRKLSARGAAHWPMAGSAL